MMKLIVLVRGIRSLFDIYQMFNDEVDSFCQRNKISIWYLSNV